MKELLNSIEKKLLMYIMTLLDKMDLIVIGTQTAKGTGLKIQLL
jgi:ABC-type Fe3+-siderophore transport system permease subunit